MGLAGMRGWLTPARGTKTLRGRELRRRAKRNKRKRGWERKKKRHLCWLLGWAGLSWPRWAPSSFSLLSLFSASTTRQTYRTSTVGTVSVQFRHLQVYLILTAFGLDRFSLYNLLLLLLLEWEGLRHDDTLQLFTLCNKFYFRQLLDRRLV